MNTYNLIFHFVGIKHPMVRWHMDHIKKYFPLFDRKVITIANMGDDVIYEMRDELEDVGAKVFLTPNDVQTREAAPFFNVSGPEIASTDPDTFLFYGHSKGASPDKPVNYAITEWCTWMYRYLLEQFPEVQSAFNDPTTDAAGIFKCTTYPRNMGEQMPGEWRHIRWHYPGTFYWVRQSAAFKDNWIFPKTEKAWHATSNELWPPYVIQDPQRAADLCPLPQEFINEHKLGFADDLFIDAKWRQMYKNRHVTTDRNKNTTTDKE